jgi:hypothetical protein
MTDPTLAKWATWAANASPAGTTPGTLDALDAATALAIAALDRHGVDFTVEDLQDAINDALG